jgi:hypothetical protein
MLSACKPYPHICNVSLRAAGSSSELLNLNPGGWSRGCTWHMFYGADANRELRLLLAGERQASGGLCGGLQQAQQLWSCTNP